MSSLSEDPRLVALLDTTTRITGPGNPFEIVEEDVLGERLPELLQAALKKGESRWDDEPYLTRVIAQGVFGEDDGITGFGLTTYITDNSYPLLVVDAEKQTVGVCEAPRGERLPSPLPLYKEVPFADFVKLDAKALEHFRERTAELPTDRQVKP